MWAKDEPLLYDISHHAGHNLSVDSLLGTDWSKQSTIHLFPSTPSKRDRILLRLTSPSEEPQKRQPLLGISHHAVHINSTLLTARQHIIIPLDSKPLTSKTHGNVTSKEHSSLMPRLVIFHPKVSYSRSTSTQVLTLVTSHRTINLHLRIEDLLFHQLTAEHTPVNWSDLENLHCLIHVQYKSRWKDLGSVW